MNRSQGLWIAVCLASSVGCNKAKPPATPPGAPARAQRAATEGEIAGRVAERLDAAGYSYLRLSEPDGETWAAVPATQVAIGAEVTIADATPMDGFESKTLNRRFEHIYFGTLATGARGPTPATAAADPEAPVPPHATAAPATPSLRVERAPGPTARTVAEVWAQRAALKDKNVSVRGQVVKATQGVFHTNWYHLHDGSGSPEHKDDDLTVTSNDKLAVGDVATFTGPVHTDRDFGSGYAYEVIVEGAVAAK